MIENIICVGMVVIGLLGAVEIITKREVQKTVIKANSDCGANYP